MNHVRQSKTQQAKRYLVNKMPHMSEQELMIVRSMIDRKLRSMETEAKEASNAAIDATTEWDAIGHKMQSKVRYQLLYNAIQSRLISNAHVPE